MANFGDWLNKRFPLRELMREHLTEYFAPKNFNFLYYTGSLLLLMIVMQFITGFLLMAHYVPTGPEAFNSVQGIMYDTRWGWLIRYMHVDGVSLIFVLLYLHIGRGMLYGSYRKPRELLWIVGYTIYILMMGEAFLGYVLPFGNLSYWAGQVITSIIQALPAVGPALAVLARGGAGIGTATLERFLALHAVLWFWIIAAAIFIHILALHQVGSNNPDGIEIKENKGADGHPVDGIPFHPYYTVKDIFGVGVWLTIFAAVIFYAPTMHGVFLERTTFSPANPMVSLPDVTPPWYLAPFYAMLRAIPNKDGGIFLMILAVVLPFFLPWLDRSPVKSSRYRPVYRAMILLLAVTFFTLAWVGEQPPLPKYFLLERGGAAIYVGFYLLLPIISRWEPTRKVPERVTS
ncbi:MAG: cytochrome b N-terminal domain-containing protein [Gammaproteobacteria bacterium]|nr:cytochrome b N-terminal domain-containing protein [Gammaproteobacteria bacterium]